MNLELRELTPNDEAAFFAGLEEWKGEKLHWHTFSWKDGMPFDEMLAILDKERRGVDLPPGRVKHTMHYAFVDGVIVGRISVRHELNDYLRKRGGNIGYAVAPRFRKKGYATEIVRQGLEFCKSIGLNNVMVSCADANVASWKIIEKFGGKLQDKVFDDEDDEMIRRYWINL